MQSVLALRDHAKLVNEIIFQIEIQTFIACDPEGDTQKMSCHMKEQVYLYISKEASSRHYM